MQNNVHKKWNIKGTIISQCSHHGLPTNSYVVRSQSTGRHITHSEGHLRAVKADSDLVLSETDYAHLIHLASSYFPAIKKAPLHTRVTGCQTSVTGSQTMVNSSGTGLQASGLHEDSPSSPHPAPQTVTKSSRKVDFSPILEFLETDGLSVFRKDRFSHNLDHLWPPFKHENIGANQVLYQKALQEY